MKDIIIVVVQLIVAFVYYKLGDANGYARREKEFQDGPITFTDNNEKTLWIGRESGIIKIRIFKDKLVEILK